jgi:hypothetical protein
MPYSLYNLALSVVSRSGRFISEENAIEGVPIWIGVLMDPRANLEVQDNITD